MESPARCHSDHWHFKSASFRNNEQFRGTWTELIDFRSSSRKRITNPDVGSEMASWFAWTFATLSELDRRFSLAEKIPMLRGYIAEVIEVLIHPELSSGLRAANDIIDMEDVKRSQRNRFFLFFPRLGAFYNFVSRDQCSFHSRMIIQLFLDNVLTLDQADLELTHNVIVSVVVLSIVYQYLLGYFDRGGTKTYNPGSSEFRATYISLLLFRGAYVWIKFRDVAPRTVYRRSRTDEFGQVQFYGKYEPRFKPPREKGYPKHNYLPLGGYDTEKDAKVVCQIAGFYYGKDEGAVAMEDGSRFSIPEMSEQERSFCGEEKRKWVSAKAKAVFRQFKERAALSANAGEQVDARGFSPPADLAVVAFSTTSDDEFPLLSGLAHEHHDLMMPFDPDDLLNSDPDLAVFQEALEPTMQERLDEQLNLQKEQLLPDFNGRLAEEHQKRRRLEEENMELREENMELRQENKHLKTMLQQAATPLRAFFVSSTVELEGPIENC